jgi:ABC-type multidrug transport system fused ATPase/permease subunit
VSTLRHALNTRLNSYMRLDIYRRMFPYLKPFKGAVIAVVTLTSLGSFLSLASPWPLAILIDSGLSGKPLPGWLSWVPFVHNGDAVAIIVFAVFGGVALTLFRESFDILVDYLKTRVNWFMHLKFRCDLFHHLQRLSFRHHDRSSVGDSLYRLEEDSNVISSLVWSNFRHLLTSIVTFLMMLVIILRLDWQLTLLALASAPLTLGVIARVSNRFRATSKAIKAMEAAAQTIAQEVISSLRVVKAFGQEEREQRRYEAQSAQAVSARLRLTIKEDLLNLGLGLVGNLNRAAILLLGALHVHHGSLTIGELTVIMVYVDNLTSPISEIGETVGDMQMSLASGERIMEVFDVDPEIVERPGATELARVAGAVEFDHVSFSYTPGEPILRDVAFSAAPGDIVAIVGPTGAGKTTIASLLVRFYDPDDGRVLLDGHDLRDLSLGTLRENTALVIQEPILFSATIAENIAYGKPEAAREEIVAAAKGAHAHDFISRMPEGYETEVGQRGMRLSGGERQRISIARAFVRDAPVLILDEPTSSIDVRTEATILDALDRLMVGRTTFIIAHRLSTIRRAKQILTVDGGRIVEQGTHAELLLRGGLYAELYHLQTGEPPIERGKEVTALRDVR